MTNPKFGTHGLMMIALSCFGCDAVGSEAGVDPSQQGLDEPSAENGTIGVLVPTTTTAQGDGGRDFSLTSQIPTKSDAGVVTQGDAGQGDAGLGEVVQEQPEQGDAGQTPQPKVLVAETPDSPNCDAVYFRDLDSDNFGDSNFKVTSCTQPAGYVEVDGDCYDNNQRVHPNATGQFLQHRGDGSFDYDCDGVETKLQTAVAVCPELTCTGLSCDTNALEAAAAKAENGGWTALVGGKLPACGEESSWGLSVSWYPLVARAVCAAPADGTTRTQMCR